MLHRMGLLLGHCRSEVRNAYKEGRNQPNWVDNETWARIKAEQSSNCTSHLGSERMDAIKRDFVIIPSL